MWRAWCQVWDEDRREFVWAQIASTSTPVPRMKTRVFHYPRFYREQSLAVLQRLILKFIYLADELKVPPSFGIRVIISTYAEHCEHFIPLEASVSATRRAGPTFQTSKKKERGCVQNRRDTREPGCWNQVSRHPHKQSFFQLTPLGTRDNSRFHRLRK